MFTAGSVGVAAGCMGTWMEMSHAVICVPVVTLPPMQLSHHIAIGSTVFGVAARQIIAASLYALDPANNCTVDELENIIDFKTASLLSASGTVTALGASAFSARLSGRHLRKMSGLFMVGLSLFMYWRDNKIRLMQEAREKELAQVADPEPEAPAAAEESPKSLIRNPLASLSLPDQALGEGNFRLIFLGSMAGVILGLFGIGPAWMLAPILTHTAPKDQQVPGIVPQSNTARNTIGPLPSHFALEEIGLSASDQRTRLTSCFAMVPPSIAAGWRHYRLGHIQNGGSVAIPLAVGAVLGSAIAGSQLGDVPASEELRYMVSLGLFANGCWSFFKA